MSAVGVASDTNGAGKPALDRKASSQEPRDSKTESKSDKRSRPELGQRGFNALVVPSNVSDPVTCFDVDLEAGYLVTGTAAGKVYCWRIDHILPEDGARRALPGLLRAAAAHALCAAAEPPFEALGSVSVAPTSATRSEVKSAGDAKETKSAVPAGAASAAAVAPALDRVASLRAETVKAAESNTTRAFGTDHLTSGIFPHPEFANALLLAHAALAACSQSTSAASCQSLPRRAFARCICEAESTMICAACTFVLTRLLLQSYRRCWRSACQALGKLFRSGIVAYCCFACSASRGTCLQPSG
jgi:hypothetical protein